MGAGGVVMIDGSPHTVGDRRCSGCSSGPRYRCACGGLIHQQSVYGPSILDWCDQCGDPDKHRKILPNGQYEDYEELEDV